MAILSPKLTMIITHKLTFVKVQNRLNEYLFKGLKDVYPEIKLTHLHLGWESNSEGSFSCKVNRRKVTAEIKLEPGQVTIEVQSPLDASTQINVGSKKKALKASLKKLLS